MNIGVIGLGFVGQSMFDSFKLKNINITGYDKYKNGGINSFNDIIKSNILFLCLPTKFNEQLNSYDKKPIIDTCIKLENINFKGIIVIKSTVEPETTYNLEKKFNKLQFIHNPEFLTAATAFEDFHNQRHIVLGKGNNCSNDNLDLLKNFYHKYYPNSEISVCTSLESESMKLFCNCFYAAKVQFFNELYMLCQKNKSNYNTIKNLMLKNNWINQMHTKVPGTDGKLSYGGYCFPKDTNALLQYMKHLNTPFKVMEAVINERNEIRNDNINCE